MIQCAQHGLHLIQMHMAIAVGQSLIRQAQGIPHTAFGSLGQQRKRRHLVGLPLSIQHPSQLTDDQLSIQRLEMKLQAAGEHGNG